VPPSQDARSPDARRRRPARPGLARAGAGAPPSSAATAAAGDVRVGLSGWRYASWRGPFYPPGLAQRRELAFAARAFGTLEINGSFYSLQSPRSWHIWREETPPGFRFAVKGPRYVTHLLKLRNADAAIANFFASGVLALGDKLETVLWQLPPQLPFDAARLEAFLAALPHDTAHARALAASHDARLAGRTWFEPAPARPLRHALEVRHPSFEAPAFVALLRRHGVALVVADSAGLYPWMEDVTADFVYVRLHGDTALYRSAYGDAALAGWARRIEAWARGGQVDDARVASRRPPARRPRDVRVYFDNDTDAHAPRDAARLAAMLGLGWAVPEPPPAAPKRARSAARGTEPTS
jgi:uncharacterized protein YecE (DUF72 family)